MYVAVQVAGNSAGLVQTKSAIGGHRFGAYAELTDSQLDEQLWPQP